MQASLRSSIAEATTRHGEDSSYVRGILNDLHVLPCVLHLFKANILDSRVDKIDRKKSIQVNPFEGLLPNPPLNNILYN